jgi:predicted RNA-binding Zn-ribbon protein involved in translation (DUF1610 family)
VKHSSAKDLDSKTQKRNEEEKMQTSKFYTIDLARIGGKGDVKCPKCGIMISPDDTKEKAYTISEPVMRGDCLERIVLQCNSCRSQIHLTGFAVLNEMKR